MQPIWCIRSSRVVRPKAPPRSVRPSDLPKDQRIAVLTGGMLTGTFVFIGQVILDGVPVSPLTWVEIVGDLVRSKPAANVTTTRRRILWETVKATGDPGGTLKSMSLDELRAQLAANPDAALYVAPGVTVAAPTSSRAFLNAAKKGADEWHGKLDLTLGKDKKHFIRAADLPTQTLALHGTLVIGGQCHLPGCWPDEHPTAARLKKTPFRSPTVPPWLPRPDPSTRMNARASSATAGPALSRPTDTNADPQESYDGHHRRPGEPPLLRPPPSLDEADLTHLADQKLNDILVRDFNRYTYGRWRRTDSAEATYLASLSLVIGTWATTRRILVSGPTSSIPPATGW